MAAEQKLVEVIPIDPPPKKQRVKRELRFAAEGEKKNRYSMPTALESGSPIGYRVRVPLTQDEAHSLMPLLSLERPTEFVDPDDVTEEELFEENALGVLSARQSTNYRGHRQVTLGPEDSKQAAEILSKLNGLDHGATPLPNAAYTHIVLSRPYRTPFTMLLTLIGHKPVVSLATVAVRALRKKYQHIDDIPTIGYLQQLHLGILADAMERAAPIASAGKRHANVFMAPFVGDVRKGNQAEISKLERLVNLSSSDRAKGWRIALVTQVGQVAEADRFDVKRETYRKFGANLLAFRSERIQPGVNQEEKAPEPYQHRQDMDVPDELTVMAGRAAYNAFVHWTGVDRERSKDLLLLERIDVLTPNGKERLREVRRMLGSVTDTVAKRLPLWADLPAGKAFSRNVKRGKNAFALAGQRIYVGGLDRTEVIAEGVDWNLGVRAFGASAARSALVAEIMGTVDLPNDCDLLAGICLMAGPVNQNDIGKEFYGHRDILAKEFPNHDPTSLLVWTMKAKTIADPIGNEEQLMNPKRKGALVDLRCAPHEVTAIRTNGKVEPLRKRDGRTNMERAFADIDNFVCDADGREVPGNRGVRWPQEWREEVLF